MRGAQRARLKQIQRADSMENDATATAPASELKRSLSVVDVAALGLNGVIGSGIFLLPGEAAGMMGPASILPFVFAGFLCFLIALCFAETGSRFSGTGGPYVYAREAFGGFMGFQVGWMLWWVRVIAWAALANAFSIALTNIVPNIGGSVAQTAVVTGVIVLLAAANVRGVKTGAGLTNLFTAAKLVPLAVFLVAGAFFVDSARFAPFAPQGFGDFGETTMVILWAFVGFEVLTVPAGEMKRPGRAVPLALVFVMTLVTVIYLGVHVVAIGTFDELPGSESPVAESARAFLGNFGGGLIGVGIVLSIFGTNAASALIAPRCIFALAEKGQLPAALARIHPRHKTPWIAIWLTAAVSLALALSGSFVQLAVISVVARFVQYIPTCLAALVFRRRDRLSGAAATGRFRAPLGLAIPLVSIALCLWLLTQTDLLKLAAGA
ncbi:MAG: APC family permease, partial [Planctomycetota bacterium]